MAATYSIYLNGVFQLWPSCVLELAVINKEGEGKKKFRISCHCLLEQSTNVAVWCEHLKRLGEQGHCIMHPINYPTADAGVIWFDLSIVNIKWLLTKALHCAWHFSILVGFMFSNVGKGTENKIKCDSCLICSDWTLMVNNKEIQSE